MSPDLYEVVCVHSSLHALTASVTLGLHFLRMSQRHSIPSLSPFPGDPNTASLISCMEDAWAAQADRALDMENSQSEFTLLPGIRSCTSHHIWWTFLLVPNQYTTCI